MLLAAIRRDLSLAWRRRAEVLTSLMFFIIVASLFPMGVGPAPERLRELAPGLVWITALLAALLSLGRLFAADHADGSLEQMHLSGHALEAIVLAKVIAHWLVAGLPLVLLSPLLSLQFGLGPDAMLALALSLLLGTPVLALIGSFGAALTLGLNSAGALLPLLVFPLFIPVLIFGVAAVDAVAHGADSFGHFSLLAAALLFSGVLTPFASAAALRISLESQA